MFKIDITDCGKSELTLQVFNDETLWLCRKNKAYLFDTIKDLYVYSPEQLSQLIQDLKAEDFENEK